MVTPNDAVFVRDTQGKATRLVGTSLDLDTIPSQAAPDQQELARKTHSVG